MIERSRNWTFPQLIGLSVKSWDELLRAVSLGVNMVEIKLEKFAENGTPLYFFRKGRFKMNHKILRELAAIAEKYRIEIQFHLPIERCVDPQKDTGINVGILSHHVYALRRFIMLENMREQYGFPSVITVHPPTKSFGGVEVLPEKVMVGNARIFFEMFDEYRLKHSCKTLIGIENQAKGKFVAACLGDKSKHFRDMLRNTRTLGYTVDSGHRLLSDELTVTEMIGFALPIFNFHFHGNSGKYRADNFDDDEHLLPTRDNVKGYDNYIRYFRRHRTPIVLELSHLERYTDKELREFIENLRKEIG